MSAHPRPIILATEDQLREYLDNLAGVNVDPIASGMDTDGRSFLAILAEVDDEPFYEVVWDNPTHTGKDWKTDSNICKHCGSVTTHFPISDIGWPAVVLTTTLDILIPECGEGEPVVEQPPPVDELLAEVEADDNKPGKGNNK